MFKNQLEEWTLLALKLDGAAEVIEIVEGGEGMGVKQVVGRGAGGGGAGGGGGRKKMFSIVGNLCILEFS